MGLGTNDPEKMEFLKVDFKASEEESIEGKEPEGEIGKSYNTSYNLK